MHQKPPFKANIFYALLSNAVVLAISGLTTLVIPKFIGVEEYGYWQLFTFYGNYVLLLQLGAGAGANLRYGGLTKAQIGAKAVGLQGLVVLAFTLLLSVIAIWFAPYIADSSERTWVIRLTAIFAVIINIRHFLAMQMQAVADFRSYSRVVFCDRMTFLFLVISLLFYSITDYRAYAAAELGAKAISVVVAIYLGRDLLWGKRQELSLAIGELARNIYVGLKLTLASTSSMLILGVARYFIDRIFGVAVFGSVSLVLNLSNLFMAFVNAVGLVIFPVLRRTSRANLPVVYTTLRLPLSIPPLALLMVSHPIMLAVEAWLPDFGEAVQYAPLLLTLVVFEARMGLLVMPYLKALRGENVLLAVNVAVLIVSVPLSALATIHFERLDFAVLAIVATIAIRATAAEICMLRVLDLHRNQAVWADLALVCLSVSLNLLLDGWWATAVYSVAFLLYIAISRQLLAANIKTMIHLWNSRA